MGKGRFYEGRVVEQSDCLALRLVRIYRLACSVRVYSREDAGTEVLAPKPLALGTDMSESCDD